MKLDKVQQKEVEKIIRAYAKSRGYKHKMYSIYKVFGDYFVFCDYFVDNSPEISYRIYVKEYDYDNIFWSIMQMSDNAKEPDSLRAVGAFSAPSVCLKSSKLSITEDFEVIAIRLVEELEDISSDFLKNHNIDEYIIDNQEDIKKKVYNHEVIICLAYLHMGRTEEALRFAKKQIKDEISGGYENEDRNFFEWLVYMNRKNRL